MFHIAWVLQADMFWHGSGNRIPGIPVGPDNTNQKSADMRLWSRWFIEL